MFVSNSFNIYNIYLMADFTKDKKYRVVSLKQYEQKCKNKLKDDTFGYYSSGGDDQITLRNNVAAFCHIRLLPRVLVDISSVDLKTKLLGQTMNLPFGIAPFAMQKLVHQRKQLLTSGQASRRNVPFTLSMLSTSSFQQISKVNVDGFKIMQLYFLKNAQYTKTILKYIENYQFNAIAITVDTQMFGKRRINDLLNFTPDVTLQVFKQMNIDIRFKSQSKESSFIHCIDNNVNWQRIKWIKQQTKIPIILKGVIDPEDAIKAHYLGVDAIWISNHGGRQLDTVPATILALPPIKAALRNINSKMPVYIDGGIWKGSDIFKCLALGADYVFLGRSILYSLIDGEQGIKNAFDILQNQLKITMQLCGVNKIEDIKDICVSVSPQAKI